VPMITYVYSLLIRQIFSHDSWNKSHLPKSEVHTPSILKWWSQLCRYM
jgi:hypothetical protein